MNVSLLSEVGLNPFLSFSYNYSKTKFFYSQLQPAMRKQAVYEGTSMEQEAIKKAESV